MAAHENSFAERGRTDRHGELAPPGREQSVFTDGDAVAEGAQGGRPENGTWHGPSFSGKGSRPATARRCPACVSGHLGAGRPGLLRGHPAVPVPLKCSLGAKGPPGCPGTALTAALTQRGFVALPGAQEVPAAAVLPRSEGGRVLRKRLATRGAGDESHGARPRGGTCPSGLCRAARGSRRAVPAGGQTLAPRTSPRAHVTTLPFRNSL